MSMGVLDQIGNTPLIHLKKLSEMTGNEIYGKAEFMNPGGSVKDRAAKAMVLDAEAKGLLRPGSTIYEGTAGNTGIGLAVVAAARGYHSKIVLPDNQAPEKYDTLKALGADLVLVKPCPFSDPNHFYHTARRLSESDPQGFWANQFENLANFQTHFETTGPEIWNQTQGFITDFVSATGTGGTISGVSRFLKSKNSNVKVTLVDPDGSGMKSYFETGEIKSQGSSVTEGIGIMRLTANFKQAQIDRAMNVNDQKMISMLYFLAREEGLLVGTSAALNCFAAYELSRQNRNQGKKIVTILCDSALRYQSRVFNPQWLAEKGLEVKPLTSF
ncbi:MAG: cysteine synthase A [Proteobacteria bacterium]|jgi:cysteine synthase A|nr:cysteine synthase A [Pseudomonadota bacterium]